MNKVDKKILNGFLMLLKNKERISISAISKISNVDRGSIYKRMAVL